MLQDDEKKLIRESLAALKSGLPGFRSRRPQLEMIGAVANALGNCYEPDEASRRGRSIAVVEAGTGTGKTVGYLLPAIVLAKSRQKHLVVSSSTVALQEQLFQKDAPTLQRLLPFDFTYATAKGRGRYVCIAKLLDKTDEADQEEIDFESDTTGRKSSSQEKKDSIKLLVDLAAQFNDGHWTGDRDDLKVPVPDDVWTDIVTDRQGCAGNKCPQFGNCPFYTARQRVKEADVVIANHDFVFAALEMEPGAVLPPPSETIYIFDEAHNLPAKVVDHFAARHSIRGAAEWVKDVAEATRDITLGLSINGQHYRDAVDQCEALHGYLDHLHTVIDSTNAFDEKPTRRFKNGVLPDWGRSIGENIFSAATGLQNTLQGLREAMLSKAQSEAILVQRLLAALGFYLGKLDNLVDTWALMLLDDDERGCPTARWIEKYHGASENDDYLVCASPISGGDKLCRLLWRRASAAVLTSATLTSCGSFHSFLKQTGLSRMPETRLLQVESPFDYRSNAKLVVPPMRSDPTDAIAHTEEVIERLPTLINTLGTLVLFASGKQMRNVFAHLPERLRALILMQGTLPKMEIVVRHKAAIDRGEQSVIFGLASFSEGVDLPREYCTQVILSKLPFSTPTDPVAEARREWIESQGKSAFIEFSLPEAGVRLAQSVGRLLRTDEDYGTVTVLDRRLVSKRWGARLLAGLPPFSIIVGSKKQSYERPNRGLEEHKLCETIEP